MSSSIITRNEAQKAKIQTRATVKARQPNAALLEAKKRGKLLKMMESQTEQTTSIKDIYQKALDFKKMIRSETGIIYDERMVEHRCLWDENHPEKPERFIRVIERCKELKLIERCQRIPSRKATKEEILIKHTEEHYEKLKSTSEGKNETELENFSSNYDSIYFHPSTFELSLLATGSTIDLVHNIVKGKIQNGMAIIRPPGHHAMKSEFNGYCFFNNVAVAAQYALDKLKLQKILIVDWDIHHGQGTQRLFYDDPRVLYFSIHRFEYGTFWPNLKDSNFDFIGAGEGLGYNFNLPLNDKGMQNGDYMAIFNQILLPVAVEFQPELIIISAGYDAALGCPEGEMEITPAFYPHLLNSLLCLAQSRVAVILEGGYCLESLSEGAALTLRSLLGDPCPLIDKIEAPCELVQEAILNCIYAHRPYWKCLQIQNTYTLEDLNNCNPQPDLHKVTALFKWNEPVPEKFPTRGCYPIQDRLVERSIESRLRQLKLSTKLTFPKTRVCYVYDDLMLEHTNNFEKDHVEQPDRIKIINERHNEYGLLKRMQKLKSRYATTDELSLAHTKTYINSIKTAVEKDEDLKNLGNSYNSVYFHTKTFECAKLAAGSVLQVVDNVLNGNARSGVCIVRPPGHHAENDHPHGFCIFNNVAIAAQYAVSIHGLKRVLIVDWDVHHGNGTQHIFESSSKVLYISVHRYDNASFFPKSTDANFTEVGQGQGIGFNVNIPWNKKGMGDFEYSLVFQNIIMPIAYEFNPELILVSAGFDAAIGDPLGGCKVSPEAYGCFTHWLSGLANGKIILCLEGGYNVNSISYAMVMCSKALLGDPSPILNINSNKTAAYTSCIETIQNVIYIHNKYWKRLKFNKKLPPSQNQNKIKDIEKLMDDMRIDNNINKDEQEHQEQPGPSKPIEKGQTLTDFLLENQQV
ncbi:histone deacetylase 6 isoform X2 [Condylostylus longicornis]|uniref:histone deacetylase 6 isoform X2 n=1 Tax=Condylostylus longicornis TaxID=2530218 RepID=UPI00244E150B|nr:histone deacetylase 6 isoform X2 [Condylostylus longicornis]